MLKEQQDEGQVKLEALRKAVAEGLEELDQGGGVPGEPVFEDILRRLRRTGPSEA